MCSSITLQFLVVCFICATVQCCPKEYYWREFEGKVPNDAFAAGLDRKRKGEFIGQVLHKDRLVPAKISQNGKRIYFEWFFMDYPAGLNIKIMCTRQPQKFEWLSAEKGKIIDRGNNFFVHGGHEHNTPTYIGRVVKFGNISIGKTMCSEDKCEGLYAASGGLYQQHKVFEILSYSPETESSDYDSNPNIDIRAGEIKKRN